MSIFDKLKGKKPKEFGSNEDPQTISGMVDTNEGLPSVNRSKGSSKLITNLGFVAIIGVAIALIVAANGNKEKAPEQPKAQKQDTISNTMPPLIVPTEPIPIVTQPEPIKVVGTDGAATPTNKEYAPGEAPITIRTGANGKPAQTWEERKMSGVILANSQNNGGGANGTSGIGSNEGNIQGGPMQATPLKMVEPKPRTSNIQPPNTNASAGSGQNPLEKSLEASVLKGVSAINLPDRNFLITKGTPLDCVMETAVDSSLPGLATCFLTRDVYSANGQVVLLERHTKLVGEYQGGVKQGQVRIFMLWSRAETPKGVIISLNSPGTDMLGRTGLEGWVDNHFIERFGAAILVSMLKDVVANASKSGGTTNVYGNAGDGGAKIIEKILDSTVNIPPTIVKNQGEHIAIMAARDLDFSTVYGLQLNNAAR